MSDDLRPKLSSILHLGWYYSFRGSEDQLNCEAGLVRIDKLVAIDGTTFVDDHAKVKILTLLRRILAYSERRYDEPSFVLDNLRDAIMEIERSPVAAEAA